MYTLFNLTSHSSPANLEELVSLVEDCGSEYLKAYNESSGRNATYRSTDSVIGLVGIVVPIATFWKCTDIQLSCKFQTANISV